MSGEPLAYFITIRGYGTWLHGDERGSMDPQHNAPGSSPLPTNAVMEDRRPASLKTAPVTFDEAARRVIREAVIGVCAHHHWQLLALNVRTNHLHIVVAAPVRPERVMTAFKSWSARKLLAGGVISGRVKPWSRHGSTRYLWNEQDIEEACTYVLEGQASSLGQTSGAP